MSVTNDKLMTRKEAAEYLGIRPQTLACWASTQRETIPYVRVGRSVRYRKSDLDAWIESRVVTSTAPIVAAAAPSYATSAKAR